MDQQRQSSLWQRLKRILDLTLRRPAVLTAIGGVIATSVLAIVVVMALLRTGGAGAVSDNAALIGALVALGGVFTAQMVGIALDDRRTQGARELEAQRAHEAALQNYLEQVGKLLIEKPRSLRRAGPGDNLSTVVRAQTLAVLEGLDPDRKRILLQFLYESGLIHKDKPVVSLVFADLSKASLSKARLSEANLSKVYLEEADLSRAELREANLSSAFLVGANLTRADLTGANLSEANLFGANLSGASLLGGNLHRAELREANLSGADLWGRANLSSADLREANLREAYLEEADLSRADLRNVHGVTNAELEQQAISLEGATMPDGSKHP